jgi:hypothetical protein
MLGMFWGILMIYEGSATKGNVGFEVIGTLATIIKLLLQ